MFAICNLSLIPIRRDPSDRSEMVSQLLFGETVEILGKQESWRKIKVLHDDYTGWIDKKQVEQITDDELTKITSASQYVSSDLLQLAIWNKNQICPVPIGSSLPGYQNHKFRIAETEYVFEGNVIDITTPQPKRMLEHAYMYLNSPYLWGGRSPFGIDCSGFTQIVHKLCGIKIRRDANQQAEEGSTINLLDESKPGDLAFFDNADGRIVHVGIILPANHIIHASGRVRIDLLDHQGIFNAETKSYSHNLRVIKRIMNNY